MESLLPNKRKNQKPRIGPKYQADVPSLRSSARARSQEFDNRDHLFAYGLPVPITCIAYDSQSTSWKRKLSADQSSSYASTVDSRCPDTPETPIAADVDLSRVMDNGCKDSVSSASSSKEELLILDRDSLDTEDGRQGADEHEEHAATILPKKRKKRRGTKRSCWLPKRRVTKKPRLEVSTALSVEESAEAAVDFNFVPKIVPGRRPEPWTQTEATYFRLGIFLLGKRFCEISKFIGSKPVIDVSDYYYSKFIRSPAWGRWKAAKSLRCKTAVRGEQILEGWRQVELLRRLKLLITDDAYRDILKATSDFSVPVTEPPPGDDSKLVEYQRRKKEKLDTYVFKLRDVVGLELLEQSICIGGPRDGDIGKRDLTSGPYSTQFSLPPRHFKEKQSRVGGKSLFPMGSANALSLRSEDSLQSTVSVGENCLRRRCWTTEEIARDFWERIWPALERKGWKTVERKPTIRSTPKLKFLRPGVDKLHREERGISYFDDLKQVIEAVRNDPHLRHLAEPLLEEPVEDKGDASDALVNDEEIKGGWSDDEDMFTTLDGKRTIVPAVLPSSSARVPDDSAQSSSLDIDLNRAPGDVNSRPQEEPTTKSESFAGEETKDSCQKRSGFPLGGIDLNLLPPDEECIVDAGAPTDNVGGLQREFFSISVVQEIGPTSSVLNVISTENELTLPIGDSINEVQQSPFHSPRLLDFMSVSLQAGSSSLQGGNAREDSQSTALLAPVCPIVSEGVEVSTRKRSLSYQGGESQAEWFDNGRELVSLPKKRAITLDWIPRGLGDVPGNTFFIRMNKAAVVQFSTNVSYCMPSIPASWWQSTSSTDMKFPVQGLGRAIQHCASNLLSSTCRRQSVLEALVKACEGSALGRRANSSKNDFVPGFQEPQFPVIEACASSEEVSSRGERSGYCVSKVAEDECDEDEEESTTQKLTACSAPFVSDSPCWMSGLPPATYLEDFESMVLQSRSFSHENRSPVNHSRRHSEWKAEEANIILSHEEERFHESEKREQDTVFFPQQQSLSKSIRFRIRGVGERPVVSKERSKRVPRNYSSRSGVPEPNGWLRTGSKVWQGRDPGDFPSGSGSLNSCITSNGFPAVDRNEADAQLRVKSEENDASLSPSSSLRSWDTDYQDEESLSEDQDEGREAQEAEWKPPYRRTYSAAAAADHVYSGLSKARKWRLGTCVSRRRGFSSVHSSVDSEKKCDVLEPARNDLLAETADKRVTGSCEDPVLRSSSVVENMYSDGSQVLPDREKDHHGKGYASLKTKHKRSKPRHQIRNVSCERFLIMLYTEILEEESPVQNRSSEGPFQAPSHNLPHLRGPRPNKVRRPRPLLPCRRQQLVDEQSADMKARVRAKPEGWREKEVCSGVVMTRPEQDVRFTVRSPSDISATANSGRQYCKRTLMELPAEFGRQVKRRLLSDLSASSGRQLRKKTVSGYRLNRRAGSRWQHRCSGS
ncbi:hypothetical protein R1sor_024885 [Riccia sorocarpa]|uniref:Myb-like domain-containing protein n=1 Tax=Riccia sorocarpa TaxID=122646 RepID=A0ABD3GU73_9MARC